MAVAYQPLTPAERRIARRRLERASEVVRHGSLVVMPFLPFMCACPLGPVMLISLIFPIMFFRFVHSYFAEAAEDIFNEQRKPLLFAVVVAALVLAGAFMATAAIALKLISLQGGVDRWVIMILPLGLLGFAAWLLWTLVRGLNALERLRAIRAKGFDVVVVAQGDAPSTPAASEPVLPPRPNLGPRRYDRR